MANNVQKAAYFIALMFNARTATHFQHLKVKSYAKHVALAGFYDGIVDLVDGIAESYQGKYGIIGTYPAIGISGDDPVALLEQNLAWIEANREAVCDDSFIQNQIDAVVELHYSTLYKLKNLA